MSVFASKGLTGKGKTLQAKAQAGMQLRYTKFVLGDGALSGQSIDTLTAVISSKLETPVVRLKMNPPNSANIGFELSNANVTTGFYFREIGLYALDPDVGEVLYWYGNSGETADFIPAMGSDIVKKFFDVLVYVGQSANVTAVMDSSLIYVTHPELTEAIAGVVIPDASLTVAGKTLLSNATNGTRENVAATEKAVGQAFQAGNERKAEVVSVLVAKGVTATTSETWAQLIAKLTALIKATGNAVLADVLAGKGFSNATGNGLIGTMVDRGTVNYSPTANSQVVLGGKHSGSGVVEGVVVPVANVVVGTTIAGQAGTMPNRAGDTAALTSSVVGTTLKLRASNGYRDGIDDNVTITDANLLPGNVKQGTTLLGVPGTLQPGSGKHVDAMYWYESPFRYAAIEISDNEYLHRDNGNADNFQAVPVTYKNSDGTLLRTVNIQSGSKYTQILDVDKDGIFVVGAPAYNGNYDQATNVLRQYNHAGVLIRTLANPPTTSVSYAIDNFKFISESMMITYQANGYYNNNSSYQYAIYMRAYNSLNGILMAEHLMSKLINESYIPTTVYKLGNKDAYILMDTAGAYFKVRSNTTVTVELNLAYSTGGVVAIGTQMGIHLKALVQNMAWRKR